MIPEINPKISSKIIVEKAEYPKTNLWYAFWKRFFDVVLSAVALLCTAIPMLIVMIAIRAESEGCAIYKQVRLGKDEKPFVMYKFRSMYIDAEKDGICWAKKNDSRITKVGRVIRKLRIDELPQLINILKGDMAIVGPRPERPEFYDIFDEYIDGFRQRTYVKPGLTGHAQVNGGYDLAPEEKILYDMEYIQKRGFCMDLQIVWKTVLVICSREGAR